MSGGQRALFPFPFRIAPSGAIWRSGAARLFAARFAGFDVNWSASNRTAHSYRTGVNQSLCGVGMLASLRVRPADPSASIVCFFVFSLWFLCVEFLPSISSSSRTPTHGAPIDAQHGDGAVATGAAAPTAPRRTSSRHRRHRSRSAAVAVPDAPAREAIGLAMAKLSTRERTGCHGHDRCHGN